MTSDVLQQIVARQERDRAAAGMRAGWLDVKATRAALARPTPVPEQVRVEPVQFDDTPCYWITAPEVDAACRIVYMHGGGFVAGGLHSHGALVAALSRAARASVLFVEYSLSPEARFPAALHQGVTAARAAFDNGPDGKGEASAVLVAGDSAGAALAIGILLELRARKWTMPMGACCLCGMFDLDERSSAYLKLSPRNRDTVRCYVDRLLDLDNPLASPMLADLSGLSPMFLQIGGADVLQDDSQRFAERAMQFGVDVSVKPWPEMIHVWQRFTPELPEAEAALNEVGQWIVDRIAHAQR